jgi:hypothetical protein
MQAKSNTFKFDKWVPNTKPVPVNKLPHDVCAPLTDAQRFVKIQDRSFKLIDTRKEYIQKRLEEAVERTKKNRKGKKDLPKVIKVRLGDCMFVVDVQRPLDENHVIDIIIEWDSRNWRTPKGSWDPVRKLYGITDGQHRVIAYRERIRLGLVKGIKPEDWEDATILLEVTPMDVNDGVVDYSICREQFLGENGGYTKKVNDLVKFQNEVAGKLVDSPTTDTKNEYERAAKVYNILKTHGLTPTDSKDEGNASKAGSFSAVRFLRGTKLSLSEITQICKHHQDFAKHEPLADIEVLPIVNLWNDITEQGWYDSTDLTKVAETQKFFQYMNAVVNEFGDWGNFQSVASQVWATRCKKRRVKESVPADLSMSLLLQLVKKAGYTYPGIDSAWYRNYEFGNNLTLFSCLSDDDQVKFK